ncbi:acetyl-CoA decarbonylase/synthase complex subunit delta [Alkalibacter mobilis]|uniref:acetyl-CoA decarbonylase/synthase complex subunit delta n=1 Tax=Alkalibacter mobilis TaxID=2787712 RepID=UPI00189FE599|nr:acetyl-CoA decarbonylase/synthase complex subunit delta [Alkalibacter mobilis]MBF7096902.1 acetyl-CoA decarbonylase/synthase complex subunit delta [Alkalibacter mobilis]
MGYKKTVKKYNGTINKVTLGTGEKAFEIGGRNVMPFYKFDGEAGEQAKVGIEISDEPASSWSEAFAELYKEAGDDTAAWAKLVEEKYAPDFICLRFDGADPNGKNKSVEECVEVAKKVADEISVPLVVAGSKNDEKDSEVFQKIAEALQGKNILILSAKEENYKAVGAAGALAYNQKISAESSVDINLAKQLNILLGQLGVKKESVIMDIGSAAVGYGFEYVTSTMDRILLASLGQNDDTLQMPIITPISFDVWSVKEALATEADEPAWGNQIERGIHMEVSTAVSCLVSGSDAVIVRHPKSLETVKKFIEKLS